MPSSSAAALYIAALPMLIHVSAKCCAPDPWLGWIILNSKVFPINDLLNHCKSKLVLLILQGFTQLIIINITITNSE